MNKDNLIQLFEELHWEYDQHISEHIITFCSVCNFVIRIVDDKGDVRHSPHRNQCLKIKAQRLLGIEVDDYELK